MPTTPISSDDAHLLERQALMPRVLFTAEEAAEALAISESLVRQLTLCGELPCRRIGRLVRYTASDLEAFVRAFDARGYGSPTTNPRYRGVNSGE